MTRIWSFREEKDVIASIHRGRNERDESRREFRFIFETSLLEFNEKNRISSTGGRGKEMKKKISV